MEGESPYIFPLVKRHPLHLNLSGWFSLRMPTDLYRQCVAKRERFFIAESDCRIFRKVNNERRTKTTNR